MSTLRQRLWQTPHRLSTYQAKVIAGLALGNLVIAATGLFLYEGLPRVVHVSALALVGLANLVWALGSVLPEERGGRRVREVVVPLGALMLVALAASVTHLRHSLDVEAVLIGILAALASVIALRLTSEA